MNLLILGGGVFLGRAVVDDALSRGHRVTVFNRGRSRSEWPAGVEAITGDRLTELGTLSNRRWDVVIDTCGYLPGAVSASATTLRTSGQYLFVSSISAFASFAEPGLNEESPLASFDAVAPDDRNMAHYGAQKAACEAALQAAWGSAGLVVRPGLIVGPGDRTGRFSYWPWRMAAGGAMLVPDVPDSDRIQVIDVRDLAHFMLQLVEQRATGAYNATGRPMAWGTLLQTCTEAVAKRGLAPAQPCQVPEALLLANNVAPWSELPLWIPSSDADMAGFSLCDTRKAEAAGLRERALRETIGAVLDEGGPTGYPAVDDPRRQGKLTPEREAALMAQAIGTITSGLNK